MSHFRADFQADDSPYKAKLRICGIARSSWEKILSSQTDTMLAAPHTIQDGWRIIIMVWANLGLFEVTESSMKGLKHRSNTTNCARGFGNVKASTVKFKKPTKN